MLLAVQLNLLGGENLQKVDVESLLCANFETAMVQQTQFSQCFMEPEKKLRNASWNRKRNCERCCCSDVLVV